MLTSCNTCNNRFYTNESPLWFHCDKCLKDYQKQREQAEKNYQKELERLEKENRKQHIAKYNAYRKQEQEMGFCDGCGMEYRILDLEYITLWNGYFCSRCNEMEVG
jgi:hypothetical protein